VSSYWTRRPPRIAALLAASSFCAGMALAGAIHEIAQKDRNFAVGEIEIADGDTLRFTNEDDFLHQIYVATPSFSFDSEEQAPGKTIELRFPSPGRYVVLCHIHPKMHLYVRVK
jgi:plastocyanin